jgi:hypothetical protein
MPFRHLSPGQFDRDLLKAMQVAYDAACPILGIDRESPRSIELATFIITLASEGEREHLLERALDLMKSAPKKGRR